MGSKELPKWQCHKVVRAVQIKEVVQDNTGRRWSLIPDEPGISPFEVSEVFVQRHKPESGGYFVVYEDGYESYSPYKAFAEGYSRIEEGGIEEG